MSNSVNRKYQGTKFGMVIGRFQPFHFGHEHIINEIILDGKTPIVLITSDNYKNPERNPLSFLQRMTLIETVFPGECICINIEDNDCWDTWYDTIVQELSKFEEINSPGDVTLYYNNKEVDRYKEFTFRNTTYSNEFYTKIFEDEFCTKQVEFVSRSDIHVDADATNLRDNFEDFKHLLDGRVYWKLKEWGW